MSANLSSNDGSSLRNTIIDGSSATISSLHQALADAAEAHVHASHRGPCTPKTRLLFAHMDFHGVGNDLNSAVRAFSCAIAQSRQVVFLPPRVEDRAKHPWLNELGLSWRSPWHWLHRAGLPFDSLIVASSCQVELSAPGRSHLLEALSRANDSDASSTLTRLGETTLAKVSRTWHPIWRVGLTPSVIPPPFRAQGLLWWFQVLGSYLIRARGPFQRELETHPAMAPFQAPSPLIAESRVRSKLAAAHFGRAMCQRRACDSIGVGWHPPIWFDVGLHIRMGDVCGKHAPKRGQKVRKCSQRPLEDALTLMRDFGLRGTLFFASDSGEAIAEAASIASQFGFNVSSLAFERDDAHHDATACAAHTSVSTSPAKDPEETGLELCKRGQSRERALLVEALLDSLMLSHSSVLVGAMIWVILVQSRPRFSLMNELVLVNELTR